MHAAGAKLPLPLLVQALTARRPPLSPRPPQSERIVWGLRKIGLLDEEGRLTADPDVKKVGPADWERRGHTH